MAVTSTHTEYWYSGKQYDTLELAKQAARDQLSLLEASPNIFMTVKPVRKISENSWETLQDRKLYDGDILSASEGVFLVCWEADTTNHEVTDLAAEIVKARNAYISLHNLDDVSEIQVDITDEVLTDMVGEEYFNEVLTNTSHKVTL